MKSKWCLAVIIWIGLVSWSCSSKPVNNVPAAVAKAAFQLTNMLEIQGFEVSRGYFKLYQIDDCDYSYAVMKSCFANNPAAPYIIPVVYPWADEWLDPKLNGVFGPTLIGYSPTFRLDPREAIVILGQLPPPAKYFGLQTYVFTRQGDYSRASPQYLSISQSPFLNPMLDLFFAYDPIDSSRIQILASLGNSNNNVVIQTASGAAFNQQRYFIITPDQTMDAAVREAFSNIGIQNNDIFTEPISSLLQVGLGKEADDFFTAIRYAMPDDEKSGDTWRQDLPLVVLRVRDHRTQQQPVSYPPVQPDPRTSTNPPETALASQLTTLVNAVCQQWGLSCNDPAVFSQHVLQTIIPQRSPILEVGPQCIPVGENCLADTQDTTYSFSPRLPFGGQRVYAAVGALSTKTGNATYVGLGINASKRLVGIDNVSDAELAGSASYYCPSGSSCDQFFVYYLARDCTTLPSWASQHCRTITASELPDYDPSDPNPDRLMLSLRDYMFPGTSRGPNENSVLPPYVIVVKTQ
jgi:hypothetical protein